MEVHGYSTEEEEVLFTVNDEVVQANTSCLITNAMDSIDIEEEEPDYVINNEVAPDRTTTNHTLKVFHYTDLLEVGPLCEI